ncbi:porphobilinogen deaminase [Patellaria atrata CBS 101060]|uniref:Porphobilinogen deaminase n=1 Tax=Patellaria atrata CBS 101060 TaxID=1346257 RepID=A0A9P4S8U6_9PEZI|nr:porphobilinogen deaminase [Patellaria atrata CBS 101060]
MTSSAPDDSNITSAHNEPSNKINIGTRRSALARIQADLVRDELQKAWPEKTYEIHAMSTMGDKNQVTPLHEMGAKALWTHELEALLLEKKLDGVVHCLKDMPTQLPANLKIGAILPGEDPRDVLVVRSSLNTTYSTLSSLPASSIIGTSSVRRSAQIRRKYPHLQFADVRGNIGTRLSKLDDPESPYTALVLAAAGLKRLGLDDRISQYLTGKEGGMLHAVGQGALAIEIREGDDEMECVVKKIACWRTTRQMLAQRSLMRTLEGGCSVPIGVETEWVKGETSGAGDGDVDEERFTNELVMSAIVVSLDGADAAEGEIKKVVRNEEDADEFGRDMARLLIERGASEILEKINLNRKIIEAQGDA